jgi:hypothetical protein
MSSLCKLLVCGCTHSVDYHDAGGCHASLVDRSRLRCPCDLRPDQVLELAIAGETEAARVH